MNINLKNFEKKLKEQGKKSSTIRSYSSDMSDFIAYIEINKCPIEQVDTETIHNYFKSLKVNKKKPHKPNSIRRKTIAIRQFFRHTREIIDKSPYKDDSIEHVPIPTRIENTPTIISDDEVQKLLVASSECEVLKFARDTAVIALLSFEGIKAREICELKWEDYYPNKDSSSLLIRGERQRSLILTPKTTQILNRYQNVYNKDERVEKFRSKMFIAFKGPHSKKVLPEVTRHGLKFLIYRLGEICNLHPINTESLRTYSIQYMGRVGKSSEEIMKHLGLKRLGNIAKITRN